MKRLVVAGLVACLAVPAAATASPAPSKQDRRNAVKECLAERGKSDATREAFRANHKSFVACVRKQSRDEHAERHQAVRNAAQECRDLRGDTEESQAAFREEFGTNRNKRNAFGNCVSMKAAENMREEDAEDAKERRDRKNAARECDELRGDTEESREKFRQEFGTNRNKQNAFGKCVSQKANEQDEEEQAA